MKKIITLNGVDCYEQDGTVYLKLENVARGLGFVQKQHKKGKEYTSIRWETINRYLADFGFPSNLGKDGFIPENIFYRLAMKAKNETAEKFQALVADEIIPSIRRTGSYSVNLSPAKLCLQQAKVLVDHENRLAVVEDDLMQLKASIETRPTNWYTIAGYASLRGVFIDINHASMLGRKATKLSKEYGYKISETPDPRFGKVNVYHVDVLKEVFNESRSVIK